MRDEAKLPSSINSLSIFALKLLDRALIRVRFCLSFLEAQCTRIRVHVAMYCGYPEERQIISGDSGENLRGTKDHTNKVNCLGSCSSSIQSLYSLEQ